ncbi:MAG: C10 family peptidase [Bacteroidales bacterium]|nr:C10 family peptidase [Bacteroidales bacterium]
MKRFLSLIVLFAGLVGFAQSRADMYSFKVMYPQGTVTQGDYINVTYFLEALNYSVKDVEEVPGLKLEAINRSKKVLENGFDLVTTQCMYTVVAAGEIPLPKLDASVNGKPVSRDPIVLNVLPNPKYGKEWVVARDFLVSKGVKPDNLVVRYTSDALAAFSDNTAKAFAVVVRKAFEPYMDNPILAYGIGNSMWDGNNRASENSVYHILSQYSNQIQTLRSKGELYHSLPQNLYMGNPTGVKPLLGDIKYGQNSPYNAYFPKEKYQGKDSTCLVGCGPVALAEVLAYYKYPEKPVGKGMLNLAGGKQMEVNMKDAPFSWDGSKKAMAALMLCSAASVNAELGAEGTSSQLIDFKPALMNNWEFSAKCSYLVKEPDMTMIKMVYDDLNAKRPVIVADAAHIFVIDGYDQDYLHLNLGWNGYCNGYYRAIIIESDNKRQLPFDELLAGIQPKGENEEYSVAIKLSKPGTLEKELGKLKDGRSPEEITSLKLSGKINGWDLAIVRRLAGAATDGKFDAKHGVLTDLDLSDAILTHGGCYVTRSASKMTFSGQLNGVPYRYDMARLTSEQWMEMQSMGLSQGPTWLIKPAPDGGFQVSWYEENDTIGPYMFSDCQNLRSVILPKNIKEVMGNAFSGSKALQSVTGLPKKVADDAFENSSLKGKL